MIPSVVHRSTRAGTLVLAVGSFFMGIATPGLAATPSPERPDCPASLQEAVDTTPAGGILDVTGCTFRGDITITRPMTLVGGMLDAAGRDHGVAIRASDVVIDGTRVINADNPTQSGAIDVDDADRVILRNVTVTDCHGAAVSFSRSDDSAVLDSELAHCAQEGYHGTSLRRFTFTGNVVHHNGGSYDPFWEAGGGKTTRTSDSLFAGNLVHDNLGPGLWCDIDCRDVTYRGNRAWGNTQAGIFYEISTGGLIEGNVVWDNGWEDRPDPWWPWGAGILVSSSGTTEVRDNVVAWNSAGITVISQARADRPAEAGRGISVHDNDVISRSGRVGLSWNEDWAGPLLADPANSGRDGRYWWPDDEGSIRRYGWGREIMTLAAFNETPGEERGQYLATAERDAVLAGAGIPVAPPDLPPGQPTMRQRIAVLAVAVLALVAVLVIIVLIGVRERARSRSAGPSARP